MAHRKEVMGMEKKIECRRLALRAADQEGGGEGLHVEGYAAVFNEKTLLCAACGTSSGTPPKSSKLCAA